MLRSQNPSIIRDLFIAPEDARPKSPRLAIRIRRLHEIGWRRPHPWPSHSKGADAASATIIGLVPPLFPTPSLLRKFWLLFAQASTLCLAALFVVATLRPDLLPRLSGRGSYSETSASDGVRAQQSDRGRTHRQLDWVKRRGAKAWA